MDHNPGTRGRGYQNLMLTAIAGLLALGALERHAGPVSLSEPALAQPQTDGGLANALDQRKQIITELRTLNSKIDRIESKLSSGLSVKITDMPPLKLPPEAKAKGEPKPGSGVEVRPADGK